jgi:aconitate hydratase 2/2-methylisocitrate dehydratase
MAVPALLFYPCPTGEIAVLEGYFEHVKARAEEGLPPLALDATQTAELVELLKNPPAFAEAFLFDLISNHVPAGVNDAAYIKAGFLSAIVRGDACSPIIGKQRATELLAAMEASQMESQKNLFQTPTSGQR